MQGPIQTKPVRAIYAAARGHEHVVRGALVCHIRAVPVRLYSRRMWGHDLPLLLGMLPRPLLAQILKTIKDAT